MQSVFFLGILPKGGKIEHCNYGGGGGGGGAKLLRRTTVCPPRIFLEFRCFEIASGAIWVSSGTSMDMSYFILIYGDRDGNLSMLKGRLQVLKQVLVIPLGNFLL